MRIGVDARNLLRPGNGIARYIIQLTSALSKLGVEFTFYWPQRRPRDYVDHVPARHLESSFVGGLGRVVWSHTHLPISIRRDRPDVFWGPAHRLPPHIPADVPRVVTIHDMVWHRFPHTMRRAGWLSDRLLMRDSIKRADRVIAVSACTAVDIVEVFGPLVRRPVAIIHPGATPLRGTASTDSRARFGIDRPYALFVGTREPRKNLPRLIAGFAQMLTVSKTDCLLVVVGAKGWRDKNIQDVLSATPAASHLRVTGYVSDCELASLYAGARFVAMPSLYEGFGLPVLEAHHHGVPVLASNAGSLPEAAGEGGLLVDPHDVSSIATGLQSLFENDALHARLAQGAKRNLDRFSWEKSARGMLEIFQDVRAKCAS